MESLGKELVFYHSRQIGDVIRGSHIARLVKRFYEKENPFLYFYTDNRLVNLLTHTAPWINICIESPMFTNRLFFSDPNLEINDLADKNIFLNIQCNHIDSLCFQPRWNIGKEFEDVTYGKNFILRCFAKSCNLNLPIDDESSEFLLYPSIKEIKNRKKLNEVKILIHTDNLSCDIPTLIKELSSTRFSNLIKQKLIVETLNTNQNILNTVYDISAADIIITRFGGVSTMAAAVRTPCISLVKPESTLWADAYHSHPNDFHSIVYPTTKCAYFENKIQPCMKYLNEIYLSFNENKCVNDLGKLKPKKSNTNDFFHCWRDIDINDIYFEVENKLSNLDSILNYLESKKPFLENYEDCSIKLN